MKKEKIKILVDETVDLIHGLEEEDVGVMKGHMFRNNEEIHYSREKLYNELNLEDDFNTSQPSPEEFKQFYEEYPDSKLIQLTVPSKLSGTYNSAVKAAEEVSNEVTVIDSENTATGMGLLAKKGVEAVKEGKSYEEVVKLLRETVPRVKTYLLITELDYLIKSGRVNKAAGLLGGLMRLKPILGFENGELKTMGKMVLFKKAVNGFYEFITERAEEGKSLYMVTNNLKEERKELKNLLEKDGYEVHVNDYLTPILGIIAGPEVICVSWINE